MKCKKCNYEVGGIVDVDKGLCMECWKKEND